VNGTPTIPLRHSRRCLAAAALAGWLCVAGGARGDTLRVVVRQGDAVRNLQVRREGGELLLPLLACGPLLGADARWDPATNRWWLRSRTVTAAGFLDEPLLTVGGQPLLVRTPPRLIGGLPFLSLEAVRLLGRRGWETDVAWNDAKKELIVQPAQAQADLGPEASRTRALKPPDVPPGARVIALDPGHVRHSGAAGLRGLNEGDLGLALAQAVAATTVADGVTAVLLQDGATPLEPFEVASLVNTLEARAFVSFHGSEHGDPGVAVWIWGLGNMGGAGIAFDPFEPPGGWTSAAQSQTVRSVALARRVAAAIEAAGVPVRGPLPAPLLALEGLACPAVVIEFEGLGTHEGAKLAADAALRDRLAAAVAKVLSAEAGAHGGADAAAPLGSPEASATPVDGGASEDETAPEVPPGGAAKP
jgi:N-acetylmuramoyl-L-alanine amidase